LSNKYRGSSKKKSCKLHKVRPVPGSQAFAKGPKPKNSAEDVHKEVAKIIRSHKGDASIRDMLAYVRNHPKSILNNELTTDPATCINKQNINELRAVMRSTRAKFRRGKTGKGLPNSIVKPWKYKKLGKDGKVHTHWVRVLTEDAMADPEKAWFQLNMDIKAVLNHTRKFVRDLDLVHLAGCKQVSPIIKNCNRILDLIEQDTNRLESLKPGEEQ
jgi:hypothetical protein